MKHASRLALAALLTILARPVLAQSTIAGTWIADFEHHLRNENGEVSSEKGKARILFEVRGDSVFGTWTVLSPAPAPGLTPRHLRGTFGGGRVRVVADPIDALVNVNGSVTAVSMITTYEFTVNGDSLTGTAEIKAVDGSLPGMSRPFSAAREKA